MWIYKDVVRSKLCLTIFLTFTVCLSKFVCVCFCMQDFFLCVSTSVCMHVLLYEFVQKYSMYGCMHACTYAYMYICISLSTYLCVCGYCLSVSIRVYLSFHLPPPLRDPSPADGQPTDLCNTFPLLVGMHAVAR